MDDIFEQMLSTSPWEDGAGVNRATWDAMNNLAIDSMPTMPLMPLMGGGLDNPGLDRALQESSNERVHSDGLLDSSDGHRAHHHLQSMGVSLWNQPYMARMPQGPTPLSRGKSDTFLPQGEAIHRDMNLGKRARNEDREPLEGHPDSMMHVQTQPGLSSTKGSGEHQGISNEDHAGTSANGPSKPRVRARRGQATDPHSIAERNRRERIAERLRALQELVPDSNKTDKASMLDEIIGYVKFLQMQVKCLSMCRLGNAGAAVPLLADLPTEGAGSFLAAANLAQAHMGLGASQEGMAFAERQVAQLMDEDMSTAMQYLQSKGLCLMPISLATAISSTGVRQEPVPFKDVVKQAMDAKGVVPSNNGGPSMAMNDATTEEKAVGNVIQTTNDTQKDESCKGTS